MWRYLDDGSNQGTAWRGTNFNDASWRTGPAQLGFGDGDEQTVINGGPANARHITTYFRHSWFVPDASAYTNLILRLLRDDGAVVYLNGREVFRSNMPGGPLGYNTLALAPVAGSDETRFFIADMDLAFLVNGTNHLAVDVHQQSSTSSDLSFDLQLDGRMGPPPLRIERLGDAVRLSWPFPSSGYVLAAALRPDASFWGTVANPVLVTNGSKTVTQPVTSARRFYRLKLSLTP